MVSGAVLRISVVAGDGSAGVGAEGLAQLGPRRDNLSDTRPRRVREPSGLNALRSDGVLLARVRFFDDNHEAGGSFLDGPPPLHLASPVAVPTAFEEMSPRGCVVAAAAAFATSLAAMLVLQPEQGHVLSEQGLGFQLLVYRGPGRPCLHLHHWIVLVPLAGVVAAAAAATPCLVAGALGALLGAAASDLAYTDAAQLTEPCPTSWVG